MKKVAFFIDNSHISSVDFTQVVKGNPGVGGTEYMFFLVSYILSTRSNGIDIVLYLTKRGKIDNCIQCRIVDNILSAYEDANNSFFDYFVFRHTTYNINSGLLDAAINTTSLVVWCHNFVTSLDLERYNRCPFVKRIICVGREQMDLYMHESAFNKSDYIYNAVNTEIALNSSIIVPFHKREHIVTYVGSIIPSKGLLWLAEAWSSVLKEIPDAQLYIIGGGNLYYKNAKLGKWGIAESRFEEQLMEHFSKDGRIIPSVHFCGVLGVEKNEILQKTKVGVPNPCGLSETFGITAVEMQMMGARIATIRCPGYLETVFNGTLYNKKEELASTIVKELKSEQNDYEHAVKKIRELFSLDVIAAEWEKLFCESLPRNQRLHPVEFHNLDYEHKQLKMYIWRISKYFPIIYGVVDIYFKIKSLFVK